MVNVGESNVERFWFWLMLGSPWQHNVNEGSKDEKFERNDNEEVLETRHHGVQWFESETVDQRDERLL